MANVSINVRTLLGNLTGKQQPVAGSDVIVFEDVILGRGTVERAQNPYVKRALVTDRVAGVVVGRGMFEGQSYGLIAINCSDVPEKSINLYTLRSMLRLENRGTNEVPVVRDPRELQGVVGSGSNTIIVETTLRSVFVPYVEGGENKVRSAVVGVGTSEVAARFVVADERDGLPLGQKLRFLVTPGLTDVKAYAVHVVKDVKASTPMQFVHNGELYDWTAIFALNDKTLLVRMTVEQLEKFMKAKMASMNDRFGRDVEMHEETVLLRSMNESELVAFKSANFASLVLLEAAAAAAMKWAKSRPIDPQTVIVSKAAETPESDDAIPTARPEVAAEDSTSTSTVSETSPSPASEPEDDLANLVESERVTAKGKSTPKKAAKQTVDA